MEETLTAVCAIQAFLIIMLGLFHWDAKQELEILEKRHDALWNTIRDERENNSMLRTKINNAVTFLQEDDQ